VETIEQVALLKKTELQNMRRDIIFSKPLAAAEVARIAGRDPCLVAGRKKRCV